MNKALLLVAVGVALASQAEAGCFRGICGLPEEEMPEYKEAVDTCTEELCKKKWSCHIPLYTCKCHRKCKKDMIHVMRECKRYQEECNNCFKQCASLEGEAQDRCEETCREDLNYCKSVDNDAVTEHCTERLVQLNIKERWDHRHEKESRKKHK